MNLALTINQNYVMERQTAMIVWTVIYAWCKPHVFDSCLVSSALI